MTKLEVKENVQIQINIDGRFIWVKVDGEWIVRIDNPNDKPVEIEDNRVK